MTLQELDSVFEVAVGEKNFELLAELGIEKEFDGLGQKILDLYDQGMKSMRNGNIEPKRLMEICENFDMLAKELSRRVVFGKDQHGINVTLEQLFGEIKSVRPEYLPYKLMTIMSLWIIERKLRLHYQEKAGEKVSFEAVRIAGV